LQGSEILIFKIESTKILSDLTESEFDKSLSNVQLDEKVAIVTIHDACPTFSTKIFKIADELEMLGINFNIALIPFFKEKEDLTSFPQFVEQIKSYKDCEIALHGLYHERTNGEFDDFHTVTKAAAEEEIRAGLEIFQAVKIESEAFIPPAWKLNEESIGVLEKLEFIFSEMQERLLLLSAESYEKIKVAKVFNWDSTGHPEKNTINVIIDEARFEDIINQDPTIVRIALHPRDPHQALNEQKDMIERLIDKGYAIPRHAEVIPILQKSVQRKPY
jgi:predicted deacetylase